MKSVFYNLDGGSVESKEFEEDTEEIYLSSRNIIHVDFVYFTEFRFLKKLVVHYCNVSSVDLSPLSNCSRLEKLSLSNNSLSEVDLTPLKSCVQLEEVDLSGNRIERIDLTQLSNYPSLRVLDLASNKISEISLKSLETIPNMSSVILRNNHLQSVNLSPLSKSQKLMNIDLSRNSIRRIDLSPLRGSPSFRSINLAGNKLEKIELEHLSDVLTIESIVLASNQIRKIDLYPLQNCRLLKIINLADNEIQELDITPLFSCPNLTELRVDDGVMIWKHPEERGPRRYVPEGLRELKKILMLHSTENKKTKLPRKTKRSPEQLEFIESRDFSGKMYELVTEINDAFNSDCYVCTSFLSRKLMENLVISILTKVFGHTHPEYYTKLDKDDNIIGNKSFDAVLKKFWEVFESDIKKFSHLYDKKQLEGIRKRVSDLKNDFNVDVHELGTYRNKKELLAIRSDLSNIVSFLWEIDARIK